MLSRITSYNVCYTKLLREAGDEVADNGLADHDLHGEPGRLVEMGHGGRGDGGQDGHDRVHLVLGRITSYNVCYTKLLRNLHRDDHRDHDAKEHVAGAEGLAHALREPGKQA